MKQVFIGTSGYNYKDWKERFYPKDVPQKDWLTYFSKHYNTVEINATFYRSFPPSVFEKWKNQTPPDFKFTIKGSRFITHIKRIKDVEEELDRFFGSVRALDKKLAIVLWQFPKSFVRKGEAEINLSHFLSILPKDINQAIEFRSDSWFDSEIYVLLDKHNAGFVINEASAFPAVEKVTGDIAYIRFHGPEALYASSYSTKELEAWAIKIKEYRKKSDIYCYFNNDISGYAIENAKELIELVESSE